MNVKNTPQEYNNLRELGDEQNKVNDTHKWRRLLNADKEQGT